MSWYIAGTYLIGWAIILILFKMWYAYKKAQKEKTKLKWFTEHLEREEYLKLIERGEENLNELKLALLKRAMRDVARAWEISKEREGVSRLMRSGALSDEMWDSFQSAETDLQLEIYDVEADAEILQKGWGKQIISQAAQLLSRQRELEAVKQAEELKALEAAKAVSPEEELRIKAEIAERNAKELIAEEERSKQRKQK